MVQCIHTGPNNLNQTLENYIWNDNSHLLTSDLIDYHCRYIYMQRLSSDKDVLKHTILSSISQAEAGPFAYAECFDKDTNKYLGIVIENGMNTSVALTNESVINRPSKVAENHRPETNTNPSENPPDPISVPPINPTEEDSEKNQPVLPKKFKGTINLDPERPARDMGRIVDAIIEQLTNIPGAEVNLTLDIYAEIPNGIDRNKERTLTENANTLGFVDKEIS